MRQHQSLIIITVLFAAHSLINSIVGAPLEDTNQAAANATDNQLTSDILDDHSLTQNSADVRIDLDVTSSSAESDAHLSTSESSSSLKTAEDDDTSEGAVKSLRRGRLLNLEYTALNDTGIKFPGPSPNGFVPIQSRILTGQGTSLEELASNSFQDNSFYNGGTLKKDQFSPPTTPSSMVYLDVPVTHKYDSMLIHQGSQQRYQPQSQQHYQQQQQQGQLQQQQYQSLKRIPPIERFATLSYANPIHKTDLNVGGQMGHQWSHLHPTFSHPFEPVMHQLVPVKAQASKPTISDAFRDTLFKFKDSFTGTVDKVKNALGFHGFSEKVAGPDALLAAAPVAAGLLAGSLAVAYFAARQTSGRSNGTLPITLFGKRSVRDVITEEDLNNIVSRLDPVQREYLQKLQFYGPQKWKDVTCAKFIFCDVMSKATPLHVLDMQRKIGIFLSRMDESTARYVEVILKDVMLAIQSRDCSRFSCSQASWGLPLHSPAPPPPQIIGYPFVHFPGHNFMRRQ